MRFLGFFPRSLMFNGIFRIFKGFLRFIQDFRDLWGFFFRDSFIHFVAF